MKNFFANAISNELIFVYGLIALVIILIIVIVIIDKKESRKKPAHKSGRNSADRYKLC